MAEIIKFIIQYHNISYKALRKNKTSAGKIFTSV